MESWNDLAALEKEKITPTADDKNLIIIDGNNLGYRFLKRKNFSSFQDEYVRTVESLAKSYGCKDIVVAFDYGKSQYRLSLFPEYKGNRLPPADDEKEHYEKFFAELNKTQENLPYTNFKLYGVEADDIIAYLALHLKNYYPHIWIVSSDRDLYQLLDDNISIFNLFSRKELTKKWLWEEKGLTADQHKLSKIIQGDTGDNIKGIEGIGEKRGDDLAKTYDTIEKLYSRLPISGKSQYIRNLNAGREILERNEKLINLKRYVDNIIGFGEHGEQYLDTLNQYIKGIKDNSQKLEIDKVILVREAPIDTKQMTGLIKENVADI